MNEYLHFGGFAWGPKFNWFVVLILDFTIFANAMEYEYPNKIYFGLLGFCLTVLTLLNPLYLGLRIRSMKKQTEANIKDIQAVHEEMRRQGLIKSMTQGKNTNASH